MNATPQELAQVFWDKKVQFHIDMYEYGKYSREAFIRHMVFLGWNKDELEGLMDEDDVV